MAYAYIIGQITIKDSQKWQEYRDRVSATLEPWGGELLFRGRHATTLSGNLCHTDCVVIRFPDLQAIDHWHASPPYQSLIALREAAAEVELHAYEA